MLAAGSNACRKARRNCADVPHDPVGTATSKIRCVKLVPRTRPTPRPRYQRREAAFWHTLGNKESPPLPSKPARPYPRPHAPLVYLPRPRHRAARAEALRSRPGAFVAGPAVRTTRWPQWTPADRVRAPPAVLSYPRRKYGQRNFLPGSRLLPAISLPGGTRAPQRARRRFTPGHAPGVFSASYWMRNPSLIRAMLGCSANLVMVRSSELWKDLAWHSKVPRRGCGAA